MTAARKNSSACRRSSRTVAKVGLLFAVFASFLYDHDKLTAIVFFEKTSWGRRRRSWNRLATCDKKRRREGKKSKSKHQSFNRAAGGRGLGKRDEWLWRRGSYNDARLGGHSADRCFGVGSRANHFNRWAVACPEVPNRCTGRDSCIQRDELAECFG